MQTQDAPAEVLFKLWPWLEANRNKLIGLLVAVIAIMGLAYAFAAHRDQREVDAGQALTTQLLTPSANSGAAADSFTRIASEYSGTAAGNRALLQAGASLFNAGRYADAQAQFEKYLSSNPSGPVAATAQLGVAACMEAQNKPDAAAAYQRVISGYSGSVEVPNAEFALGRIAEQQNKLTEAESHYENAMRAAMSGSLAQEAGMRASELKSKLAAAKPAVAPAAAIKPATTATPATK